MTERIRVSGFRSPIIFPERTHRVRAVALARPLNLIGLVGASVALLAVFAWGTPHLLLATRASVFGNYRFYDDCAYASLDGRVVHLRGGSCPLFRLLHEGR
jgi:hypothetical protein